MDESKHLINFQEKDKKYLLQLDNISLRDIESGFFTRHPVFALVHSENR